MQVISFRLDPRRRARVGGLDVVQDAFVEATKRIREGKRDERLPFFLWLRLLTLQKLQAVHHKHLSIQARDASRDVSIFYGLLPQPTSAVIAAQRFLSGEFEKTKLSREDLDLQHEESTLRSADARLTDASPPRKALTMSHVALAESAELSNL